MDTIKLPEIEDIDTLAKMPPRWIGDVAPKKDDATQKAVEFWLRHHPELALPEKGKAFFQAGTKTWLIMLPLETP